jgi:cytochrome c oxidase subunit 2
MMALATLASLIGVAIVYAIDWFPTQASTAAGDVDVLYDVLMFVSVPIFVGVMTVVIYSVIRFKARPGDMSDGEPIHGSARLELIWVLVPFVIVSALSVYAWIVLDNQEDVKPNEMVVQVTGQQFAWHFAYPDATGKTVRTDDLVLPENRPVKFDITAEDVIHSFFVPAFRLKSDAVPGLTTSFRVTPNRLGDYSIVCAELCGLGHATMRQSLKVVPEAEFAAWLEKKRGEPAANVSAGASDAPTSARSQ